MDDLQILGASFVFTSDTEKEALLKFITSAKGANAVMLQSLPFAPNTIEVIPVFTSLEAKDFIKHTTSAKTICWKSPLEDLPDND